MNDLYLNGKYTVSKKNQEIVAKNKLTIYGAIQIARFLKKDIVFPKNNVDSFGNIISYNGQLKKVRIKQGATVSFPYSNVSNQGDNFNRKYMVDNSKTSQTILNFTGRDENTRYYFDIYLKQALNISRIGILAKYDCVGLSTNTTQYSSDNAPYCNDLSFYLRPQGFEVNISPVSEETPSDPLIQVLKGSYFRVYNVNKQTINEKPYYIKSGYYNNIYKHYCLYYDLSIEKWAIGQVELENLQNNQYSTIDNTYCPGVPTLIAELDSVISLNASILKDQNQCFFSKNILNNSYTYNMTITRGISKWIKPSNLLHYYYKNFYTESSSITYTTQDRYMTLLADTMSTYSRNGNENIKEKINYNYGTNNFDSMLPYNCYSFETTESFKQLYYTKFSGTVTDTVDFCYENMMGFAPYIDAIRFFKTNSYNMPNYTQTMTIYSIDIFSPSKTPYNPCKIALSQNGIFEDARNNWIVDSIEKKGSNTIVFSKKLSANDAITIGDGFTKIGLFGNFNGHMNGTLPSDVKISNKNCFSQAVFQYPWKKTNEEEVELTYQLTIGDEQ